MTSDGSVLGVRVFVTSSRTHPYSVGSKDGGSGSGTDFHTATWKCARKTFSLNASLVGGTVFSSGAAVMFFFPIFLDHISTRTSDRSSFDLLR